MQNSSAPFGIVTGLGLGLDSSASSRKSHCPHVLFREDWNRGGASEPISIFLESAPTCTECDLLLQVIEAFKPGWIKTNKDTGGIIRIKHEYLDDDPYVGVPTIELLPNQSMPWPISDEIPNFAGSFHFLKRSTSKYNLGRSSN